MRDRHRISFGWKDYCTNMHLTRGSIENQGGKPKQTKSLLVNCHHTLADGFALLENETNLILILRSSSPSHSWSAAAKENQLDIAVLVSSTMATQSNQLHIF